MGEDFTMHPITKENQTEKENHNEMNLVDIDLDKLVPFKGHPFQLYGGQRLSDLVDSIGANGVMSPINVRPLEEGKFEIIAGHNRVNAAKEAGQQSIPAIIHHHLTDEDAKIRLVESNFNQRSMEQMKHSELANSLHMLNEALKKKPGHRTDLEESDTGSQSDNKSRTMHVIGEKHGLSQATIARYIRIAHLTKGLQECVDNKQIAMGAAGPLSYLRTKEQKIVQSLLKENLKINAAQAKKLQIESKALKSGALTEETIRELLEAKPSPVKKKTIKFSEELYSKYFKEDQDPEEIEDTIAKALEQYLSKQNKN